MRSINAPQGQTPIAVATRAVLNRIRYLIEVPTEKISLWEFCDPNSTANQDTAIAACDAVCVTLGAAMYVPTVETVSGRRTIVYYGTNLTLNAPGGFGDIFGYDTGPMLCFNPVLGTTPDLGVGITITTGHWHHIHFGVQSPNGPLGSTQMYPTNLLDDGFFTAWGSKSLTKACDVTTFYANSAVQLLPGVGFAPGWIPLEVTGAATFDFITCSGGKIGLKNNSSTGHVNVLNSTLIGWLFGEWYAANGQDYYEQGGGRQGCMGAVCYGNTYVSQLRGGIIGAFDRVHFNESGNGFIEVQDDPNNTIPALGSAGLQCSISNCHWETIGERLFHLYTPTDGVNKGSPFSCDINTPYVDYADGEDTNFNLPAAMLTAMGITHGEYRSAIGSCNWIRTTRDIIGPVLCTDTGSDITYQPDFGCISNVTRILTKNATGPVSYANGMGAKRGELWDAQEWLPKGNLFQNPERNITTLSTTLSASPQFLAGNGGAWSYDNTVITAAVDTLEAWLATGVDIVGVNEGISKAVGPNTYVFKFVNSSANLETLLVYGNTSPGGHQGMSVQVLGTSGLKYDLNDSAGSGMLQNQVYPHDQSITTATLQPLLAENLPVVAGRSMGHIIFYVNPGATVYITNLMGNWGKPATYNANPYPGFARGFGPIRATAAPTGVTEGCPWIDTANGNVLKFV